MKLDLDELERLEAEATPGPWSAHNYDDSSSMNLYMVNAGLKEPDGPFFEGELTLTQPSVICATLLQEPACIGGDGKWEANGYRSFGIR